MSSLNRLKKEKNALILAHYYQSPEVQDAADFVGDSLELARAAQSSNAKIILFAGVHFMAEGAKILNPAAKVLLPDLAAGCSLADSCPAEKLLDFKKRNPEHFVVSYINCSAEVKALSDVICTSSNALQIVNRIPKERKILFAPDYNLGRFISQKSGREMTLWPGTCIVHVRFSEKRILKLLSENPESVLIAHPECEASVLGLAQFVGSTSQLLNFVQTSPHRTYVVATESGIAHQMGKKAPGKKIILAPPTDESCQCNDCPYMKLNTLSKLTDCLETESPEIQVDPVVIGKARASLMLMMEWSKPSGA